MPLIEIKQRSSCTYNNSVTHKKSFEITTHNLEVEQAIFQRQIKEKFEADIRQTKDAQHSKNKETTKELLKQQEDLNAAKVAAELTIKQSQYEAAETQEYTRIEQSKESKTFFNNRKSSESRTS